MNSLLFLINSILALSALSPVVYGASANYPQSKLKGMVGFAAEGKVTGGWDGEVVIIDKLADLVKCVADDKRRVCVINKGISATTSTYLKLGSNKSIIGSFGKPVLNNIHFESTENTKGNIIFQNLIFQHTASFNDNNNKQIRIKHGQKYWIDHCSFVGHKWTLNDEDKLLAFGHTADLATISNCHFANHRKGLLLGFTSDGKNNYDGLPRLTIANNLFENIKIRSPGAMRYGYYHVYNNCITKYHYGFTVHYHCKIRSENNFFESPDDKNANIIDDKGTGAISDTGSIPAIKGQKSAKSTLKVKYPYKLIPAKDVKAFVTAHAGAQAKELVFGS